MKNLKRILVIVLLFSLLVTSAGCGSKQSMGNVDGQKINISFSFWEPGINKEIELALNEVKKGYEALNPNVNIEIVAQPTSGYQEWIKAQIVANNAPDIESNSGNLLKQQYIAGILADITEEFNSPNPYNDNQIWKDTFLPGTLNRAHDFTYDPTYAVPFFGCGVAIYYNKTLYDKLGLEKPSTWNEFISNCQKIQDSGYTPIAMMGQKNDALSWLIQEITVGLFGQRILSDQNLNFNGDCALSNNEIAKAVDNGYYNYNKNSEYRELYLEYTKHLKEYLKYCPDASGLDESAAKTMFLSGNAAHIHTGSWDLQGLLLNENLKFEVATFPFPNFTKENGKYAGAGVNFETTQPVALTSSAIKSPEKKAAAVDFLKYLTSKDVYAKFINQAFQVPVIKDVDVNPVFAGFVKEKGYPPNGLFHFGSSKYDTNLMSVASALLAGDNIIFNDEVFSKMQEAIDARSQELKEQFSYGPENDYKISELTLSGGKFVPR